MDGSAASPEVLKVLNSAIANAVNNQELNRENLYVAEVYANPGPTLKRYVARSRGSASLISASAPGVSGEAESAFPSSLSVGSGGWQRVAKGRRVSGPRESRSAARLSEEAIASESGPA